MSSPPRPRTTRRPAGWRPLLAALATLCLLVAGLPGAADHPAAAAAGERLPVIVEFEGAAVLAADPGLLTARGGDGADPGAALAEVGAARAALASAQAAVLGQAARHRIEVRPGRSYGLLVNAVAAEVAGDDVERLRELPGVAAVHPDRRFTALLDVSVPLVDAPTVWGTDDADGRPVTGTGQTVAILDTGVDYTHPALGGGFGPGHKVVAGTDYVNSDGDPMDDHGHGTHVAGIVAAEGDVTGVAPGATLTAYKVLDAFGRGAESDILAALEDAVDPANPHRADVVNLSLGAPGGDGPGPLDEAARAAAEAGVVVVAAAGNDGSALATVVSPAAAEGVVAVAATTSGVRVPSVEIIAPEARPLEAWRVSYSADPPAEPFEAEVVDAGQGYPWDYEGLDVEGKAVLVHAPAEDARLSAVVAEELGAVAILFSNRSNTPVVPAAGTTTGEGATAGQAERPGHGFPHAASLGTGPLAEDGRMERIVAVDMAASEYGAIERLRLSGPVTLRIRGRDATGEVARFSSRGPTRQLDLKPEVAAPGVSILAPVPRALHEPGLYRFSGTSMAAPHVAGAAALLLQGQPAWSGQQVSRALVGSAEPGAGWGPLAQGAGRLDVARAVEATLVADPPALSLGLAGGRGETVAATGEVTLSNLTAEPVTVTFRHAGHGGEAAVRVTPGTLTVPASSDRVVTVTLEAASTGTDRDLTGWVVAETDGQPALHLPYAAFERTLHVHVPDPAAGAVEAFVHSPVALPAPPTVAVTGPGGHEATVEAVHDHDGWWRADLPLAGPGVYRTTATAHADVELRGSAGFEVLAPHQRLRGASAWVPVGPDSDGGVLAPAGHRGMAVATQGPSSLFLTRDEGRTWRQHADLPVAGAEDGYVAVDPTDPDRVYYAVGGGHTDLTYQGRLLVSTDGGTTWTTLPLPDTPPTGLHVGSTGRLLVVTALDGVHVSRDRGQRWEHVTVPWDRYAFEDATLVGDDLLAATTTGLWAVRGLAREPSGAPELVWDPPGGGSWVSAVAGDERWLFAASLEGWTGTVHRSPDGGRSWEAVAETEGPVTDLRLLGERVVATAFGTVLWGSAYGATWTEGEEAHQGGGLVRGAATWPAPGNSGNASGRGAGAPDVLLGLQAAGVYASRGPGSPWERVGVQGVSVHDLAVVPGDGGRDVLLAGTRQGLYRTEAPTASVTPGVRDWGSSGAEGGVGTDIVHVAPVPGEPDAVYRTRADAISGFAVERSDDGGATWRHLHYENERPLGLMVHPAAPEHVYVSYVSPATTGLLVSTDGGETWGVHYHREPFEAIAADPHDPRRLWLGNRHGLYASDDGGVTVELRSPGPVSAVAVDARTPDRVVVAGEALRFSEDGGSTFAPAAHADLSMTVRTVVTSPADPDVLFGASATYQTPHGLLQRGRGVLVSRDGGRTWGSLSDSLQNRSVTSLALTSDGRFLFAGTTAGGVHRIRVR